MSTVSDQKLESIRVTFFARKPIQGFKKDWVNFIARTELKPVFVVENEAGSSIGSTAVFQLDNEQERYDVTCNLNRLDWSLSFETEINRSNEEVALTTFEFLKKVASWYNDYRSNPENSIQVDRVAIGTQLNVVTTSSAESIGLIGKYIPSFAIDGSKLSDLGLRINRKKKLPSLENVMTNLVLSVEAAEIVKMSVGKSAAFSLPQASLQNVLVVQTDVNTVHEAHLPEDVDMQSVLESLAVFSRELLDGGI